MSETQSLCGSEVTRKIKQLEVEGARAPVTNSRRRQCVQQYTSKEKKVKKVNGERQKSWKGDKVILLVSWGGARPLCPLNPSMAGPPMKSTVVVVVSYTMTNQET